MMISKRTGFTLIELLVVIAIIAILAAILFPVFARARAKAQQATCLSNTKAIAFSFLMYNADYDDTFCNGLADHCTHPPPSDGYWWHAVWPYIDVAMLDCPSTEQIYGPQGEPYGYWRPLQIDADFWMNMDESWSGEPDEDDCIGLAGFVDVGGAVFRRGAKCSRVPYPQDTVMFGEKHGNYTRLAWAFPVFDAERALVPGNHQQGAGMHFGFLDGHAKYIGTEGAPAHGTVVFNWKGMTLCRGYPDTGGG